MMSDLGGVSGRFLTSVTSPSANSIRVEPDFTLLLKSKEKAAGFGASSAISPKLRVKPSQVKAPSRIDSLALPTRV